MNESLFSRLFHYSETPNMKPEENYLTEMLAWMVGTLPKFGHDYVQFLCQSCQPAISIDPNLLYEVKAQTQVSVKNGFIDMVITADSIGFICEHKIDSELSDGQLRKYRQCTNELDRSLDYKIVLVTRKRAQHKQDPDIAITWQDIYYYFAKTIEDDAYDISEEIIIKQFLMYLTEVGMGKRENINIESVKRYSEAEELENALKHLFEDLKNDHVWESAGIQDLVPDYEPNVRGLRFGRIGIDFTDNWYPGIFAGVVLKNSDHKLKHFDSPQLVVIIDCYPEKSEEIKNKMWLKKIYNSNLNHIEGFEIDTSPKNKWRLLILQKPLTEVLKHECYEEQKEELKAELLKGIKWILKYYAEAAESD